jgi:hypothetical protein
MTEQDDRAALELDRMAEHYKGGSPTQKQRAILEEQIWDAVPDKKGKKRRIYLSKLLGVSQYEICLRQYLLGTVSEDLLWDKIEEGTLPLDSANRLRSKAMKRAALGKGSPEEEIKKCLAEYYSLPEVRLPSGKVMHRTTTSRLRDPREEPPRARKSRKESGFWSDLRGRVTAYLAKQLPELDAVEHNHAWGNFQADLKSAIDALRTAIRRHVTNKTTLDKARLVVTRHKVLEACDQLTVDRPAVGKPVDIDEARRKKRAMAREYHPDHSGSLDTEAMYRAAIEAFDTIEAYNLQLGEGNG